MQNATRGDAGTGTTPGQPHDGGAEGPSDEALMTAHLEGDPQAFRRLFERHAPRMYAVTLRAGFGEADAQDLVQQTFTRAHQARHDFRTGSRLRPWLWTIAYNLMRDARRRQGARGRALGALSRSRDAAADQRAPVREARLSVARALEALAPAQRDVIILHYYEGLSFPEVARVLGIKQSAARVRAHRAYARLRELLGDAADAAHDGQRADPPNAQEDDRAVR